MKNTGSGDCGSGCRLKSIIDVGLTERFQRPKRGLKAEAITPAPAIEKMVLPPARLRFNLQLPVHSGIQPGNQPRKIWKQSLAFTALETIHLSFAKPDGMSIKPAVNPGQSNCPGFFFLGFDIVLSLFLFPLFHILSGDRLFQISH